jgi:hypothetical protein
MSRKLAPLAFVTALFALVGASPAAALDSERVIRVYESFADDAKQPNLYLDLGEKGQGPGDMFLVENPLYNSQRQFGKAKDARVGRVNAQFTVFTTHTSRLVTTFFFSDGKLEVGGFYTERKGVIPPFPVLGGTGAYANAHGTLETTLLRDRFKFVFRLFPVT